MGIELEEERIFERLRRETPDIVADGVVDETEFLAARYRIVYILKEANGGKGWDLRDFVYDGGRPQTWDNLARWTEGILSWEKDHPWEEMEQENEARVRDAYLFYALLDAVREIERKKSISSKKIININE